MARPRYDIYLKPIPDSTMYQFRCGSLEALSEFCSACIGKDYMNPSQIYVCKPGKWYPCRALCLNAVKYGVWTSKYNVRIDYACVEHFEHAIPA